MVFWFRERTAGKYLLPSHFFGENIHRKMFCYFEFSGGYFEVWLANGGYFVWLASGSNFEVWLAHGSYFEFWLANGSYF